MKKILLAVVMFVMMMGVAWAALELDFTNATFSVVDSKTFRMSHVTATVDGVQAPGFYWADVSWSPEMANWVILTAEQQQLWTRSFGAGARFYVTVDATLRQIAFKAICDDPSGQCTVCPARYSFNQGGIPSTNSTITGGKYFTVAFEAGPEIARLVMENYQGGCITLITNQVVNFTIDSFPDWFDPAKKFGVKLAPDTSYLWLEP